MNTVSYDNVIRWPKMVEEYGSLSVMEKIMLGHFIFLVRPQLIVELGTLKAHSSIFMCEFTAANGIDGVVTSFDLPEIIDELRASNTTIRRLEEDSKIRLIPGSLPDALSAWLKNLAEPIDLALIDATHDYNSVMRELSLLWPRLSPHGYILCDDYSSKYDGVRYAVDRFAAKRDIMVLPLMSAHNAKQNGHNSELAVLSRRPYRPTLSRLMYHLWLSTKKELLKEYKIKKAWFDWVKPWVR